MEILLSWFRSLSIPSAVSVIIMMLSPTTGSPAETIGLSGNQRSDPNPRGAWTPAELSSADAAHDAGYLTDDERTVVLYVNLARLYPRKFARLHIVPLRSRFSGKLLARPGADPIATNEGVAAVNECIRIMERQKPCKALAPALGLSQAATDHVKDSGPAGLVGHTGADASTLGERIDRHGAWQKCAGENIAYGEEDPAFIVIQLLIDDGVASRGHRTNIFNSSYGRIGVAIGPHETWRSMCVMDFAGGFSEEGEEM
jgi:uncharacterized protein YkwD